MNWSVRFAACSGPPVAATSTQTRECFEDERPVDCPCRLVVRSRYVPSRPTSLLLHYYCTVVPHRAVCVSSDSSLDIFAFVVSRQAACLLLCCCSNMLGDRTSLQHSYYDGNCNAVRRTYHTIVSYILSEAQAKVAVMPSTVRAGRRSLLSRRGLFVLVYPRWSLPSSTAMPFRLIVHDTLS